MNKEELKLVAALDSLYAAGFSEEQISRTAQKLGLSWWPGLR